MEGNTGGDGGGERSRSEVNYFTPLADVSLDSLGSKEETL